VGLQEPTNAGASIIVSRGGSKVNVSCQTHRDNYRPLTVRELRDKCATRVRRFSAFLRHRPVSFFVEKKVFRRKMWDEDARNDSRVKALSVQ